MSIKRLNECGILLPEQSDHWDLQKGRPSSSNQQAQPHQLQRRQPQHQQSLQTPSSIFPSSSQYQVDVDHNHLPPGSQFSQQPAFHFPPSTFQVGQVVNSNPPPVPVIPPGFTSYQQYRSPESRHYADHNPYNRQRHQTQFSASRFSLPGSSSPGEDRFSNGIQRPASQGPAPPRNVMMSASGGTAMLRGPSFSHNIHDPYSLAQPSIRSGEVGRSNLSQLVGGPSRTHSRASSYSKRTTSPSRKASHSTIAQSERYNQPHSLLQSKGSATPSTRSYTSQRLSNPHADREENPMAIGVEGSSNDNWSSLITTAAATYYGAGDYGGSFSNDFGGQEGRASGRSDGSGGSGNTGGGRSGGSGGLGNSGEGGSNGDGNEEGDPETSAKDREKAARKANPLVDLIETETAYVAELGKIIKKVAGAWSRSNFPPAELDTMFRNIESIYRVNRTFLKSLKEIGPNPSSPRALGDLLMRWIDDLETPYLRYCDNYFTDFDSWPSIQTNTKLPPLLEAVSETTQSDGTPIVFSDKKRQIGQTWTMDQLFALPQTRLKYYKKLYARLLKSTQSGRSDHRLLVGANEKLDELLQRAKKRIAMSVLDEGPIPPSTRQSQESSGGDTSRNTIESPPNGQRVSSATSYSAEPARGTPIPKDDSMNSLPPALPRTENSLSPNLLPTIATTRAPPLLQDTIQSSLPSTPRDNQFSAASDDLETRLDTSRTMDIFSMKPKKCQLRMNPPNIPFKRSLRRSADVVIYFTPSSTGQEIILRRAHIFLLTDLFLVCERMTPMERAEKGGMSDADMWLLYPPLAGKHLRVTDNGALGNSISVQILKKETMIIHTESREAKLEWIEEFDQCQKFAVNLGLRVKTSSDAESGPPTIGQANSSLLSSSREASNTTPGLSPNISITPSSKQGEDDDNSTLRDMTKLIEEMAPFSPEVSGLDRGNSFNSFVAPTIKDPSIRQPNGIDRTLMNGASPALASALARSPEPLSPGYPPNPHTAGGRPPPPMQQSSLPPGSFGGGMSSLSPTPNDISPGMQFQGVRPGMTFRPSPQGSMSSQGPPSLPTVPPPPHLVNGAYQPQQQRPQRPPPPVNGQMNGMNGNGQQGMMYGRPPPPRPSNSNSFGPSSSSSANGHGNSNGIGNGMPRPPRFQQDPSRRPSAPDLRARAGQQNPNLRRTSDGDGRPPQGRSMSASSGPPTLPSDFLKQAGGRPKEDYSPPSTPVLRNRGPKSSTVAAQMRCRLYLKQNHAQWKSLGNARIKVFHLMPDDVKQLVVENDKKPTPIISSIILPDGVERVGKVGVAIELSDNGNRTGIIYMVHLRSEESAFALFGQLLEGSDRTVLGAEREAL